MTISSAVSRNAATNGCFRLDMVTSQVFGTVVAVLYTMACIQTGKGPSFKTEDQSVGVR
jgi:hypothetical protein